MSDKNTFIVDRGTLYSITMFFSRALKLLIECKKKLQKCYKKSHRGIKNRTCVKIAAGTQRHFGTFDSILRNLERYGARVFLRFLHIHKSPKAQRKKTSFVVKENLNRKYNYVYAGFVPSVLFLIAKKVFVPKRIKALASPGSYQSSCIYSFGAFLYHPVNPTKNIKLRKGAGAIPMHFTFLCFYKWQTCLTRKAKCFCFPCLCGFFSPFFFTLKVNIVQTRKTSKWRR